jgi:hypothetical protein
MYEDFRSELREVFLGIESAEVISLTFPLIRKSLIMDTRFSLEDEPMVRILPMTGSIEERYRSIRRLRPHLPKPDNLAVIPWTRHMDSLVDFGIWGKLVERIIDSGHKRAVKALQTALDELRQLERMEMVAVIRGDTYHTLWARED